MNSKNQDTIIKHSDFIDWRSIFYNLCWASFMLFWFLKFKSSDLFFDIFSIEVIICLLICCYPIIIFVNRAVSVSTFFEEGLQTKTIFEKKQFKWNDLKSIEISGIDFLGYRKILSTEEIKENDKFRNKEIKLMKYKNKLEVSTLQKINQTVLIPYTPEIFELIKEKTALLEN